MIIIAGAGQTKSEKYISKNTRHCYHCNNESFWIYEKTKHYVSLFFVPVAPYKTEYLVYCGICGSTEVLSKEDFAYKIKTEAREYK
jgi:hypothetical protein